MELVPIGAAGLKTPVTPAGAPPRLKVTGPAKLLIRVIVTAVVLLSPWLMVSAVGLIASE